MANFNIKICTPLAIENRARGMAFNAIYITHYQSETSLKLNFIKINVIDILLFKIIPYFTNIEFILI